MNELLPSDSKVSTYKTIHFPTLGTVLMVEEVLKNADGPITKNEIKRRLEKGIMHQTLNFILDYLEDRNLVYVGSKGVSWTYKEKMQKRLKKSIREK